MCQKCYRAGKKSKLPKGKIRFFARQSLMKYNSIPLFAEKADNLAIEGEIWRMRLGRTYRKKDQIIRPLTD